MSEFMLMDTDIIQSGIIGEIGPESWTTLTVLLSHMDKDGVCYASQKDIAKDLGVSRQTANKYVGELLAFNWRGSPIITAEHANNTGQISVLMYKLSTDLLTPPKNNSEAILTYNKPHSTILRTDYERERLRMIPGYRKWVFSVKERAQFTCEKCGSTSNLVAHHIDNYRDFPKLRTAISNGSCLCNNCHNSLHGMCKTQGATREIFTKFMEES